MTVDEIKTFVGKHVEVSLAAGECFRAHVTGYFSGPTVTLRLADGKELTTALSAVAGVRDLTTERALEVRVSHLVRAYGLPAGTANALAAIAREIARELRAEAAQ